MHSIPRASLSLRQGFHLLTLMSLLGLLGVAHAERPAAPMAPMGGSVWIAESNQTLDQMRGGFQVGGGLMVSFGISRAVYVNGSLITSTSFNIGQLSNNLTPTEIADINRALAALGPIQNGPGNSVQTTNQATAAPAAPGGNAQGASGTNLTITPGATVIQNSLNNQQIISQTVINATSNAASILNGLNLQNTINEAISRAIGQR